MGVAQNDPLDVPISDEARSVFEQHVHAGPVSTAFIYWFTRDARNWGEVPAAITKFKLAGLELTAATNALSQVAEHVERRSDLELALKDKIFNVSECAYEGLAQQAVPVAEPGAAL